MIKIQVFSRVACSACGSEFMARSRIGRFQILEQLAEGGTASVFRAMDLDNGGEVALKVIRADFESLQKHERQARVMAAVEHPNIVRVFEFGKTQGVFYLAMEFLGGGSLHDLITGQGKVGEVFSLEIALQVAEGLSAALDQGLLHRDIKPANILFADPTRVKLVDFGLSAQSLGEIWGTPDYIAPEKLAELPEDFRSDLYSLGSTLYHSLTGRAPFETHDVSLAALRELKNHPVDLRAAAPGLSEETIHLVQRLMALDPADRPAGYPELIAELREVLTKVRPAAH